MKYLVTLSLLFAGIASAAPGFVSLKAQLPTEQVDQDGIVTPLALAGITCLNIERGTKDDGSDMAFYKPLQVCPPKGASLTLRDVGVNAGERWCYRAYVVIPGTDVATTTSGDISTVVCKAAAAITTKPKAPLLASHEPIRPKVFPV